MVDTGVLQQTVLDLCRDSLDIPALRAQARPDSAIPHAKVAARCRHLPRRVRLSAKASALSPGNPSLLRQHAFTGPCQPVRRSPAIFETARADGSINAQMR
jgi:hypothetical protein